MEISKDRKILITGAPRSATESITKYFWDSGIPLGHECTRENGTVSSLHAHLSSEYDVTVHQIREPLKSIISLHKMGWKSLESQSEVIHDMNTLKAMEKNEDDVAVRNDCWRQIFPKIRDKNRTRQCMKAWLVFNRIAEEVSSWSYRVEDLVKEDVYNEWLDRLGVEHTTRDHEKYSISIYSKEGVHSDISEGLAIPAPPLTWDILERLDPDLTAEVKKYAKKFGYGVD